MKIIAISNHKGGVGKTTTAHNLGYALAERGHRILLVDMDPQASLSGAVGCTDCDGRSMAEVLGGTQAGKLRLEEILVELQENLWLAPGDLALAAVEMGLSQRMGRETVLKKCLQPLESRFDLAFIDCGPSLGLLTVNGLTAAQRVIVPSQPSVLDLRGVNLFLQSIESVRRELNPDLELFGILVTQFDARYTHHRDAVETMIQAGLPVIPVLIGRSVKVAEASGAGQPILHYEPRNPQAESYLQLAEFIETQILS